LVAGCVEQNLLTIRELESLKTLNGRPLAAALEFWSDPERHLAKWEPGRIRLRLWHAAP
jgi:hypothetical protein